MTKLEIIEAIQRAAKANGGAPLGMRAFFQKTGIRKEDWEGKFWLRWGDAVREAGLIPNEIQKAYKEELLILKLIELTRELGHFPLKVEIEMKAFKSGDFPSYHAFVRKIGARAGRVKKVIEFCRAYTGFDDVLAICSDTPISESEDGDVDTISDKADGWVYLLKSGRFYKIGRTNNLTRRHGQLSIQLPEKVEIIHQIRTDDPAGIEFYWHNRFRGKRKEGEWFDLSNEDVRAFKKRKNFM